MSELIGSNKQAALRIFHEMWNGANPGAARDIFANPEGVETFVSGFMTAFPDLLHSVEEIIAEGDRVVVRFSARGTHLGQWNGLPASGRAIHYSGVTIARISGGKVQEHQTWWDTHKLIQQITGPTA